jgi:archaellum biogenesis protein FlaJ (TadC family)
MVMEFLNEWQESLLWASGLSLFVAVATILAIPWVVARLPEDYFARDKRVVWRSTMRLPVYALVIGTIKNILGLVLIILGLIMLVTPGQGLLTLLIGLLLMNFPGKYQAERWLLLRPGVLRGLNWLRERHGRAPFEIPPVRPNID